MNHELPNPKVSIIIPVYNGTNFMKYAIDGALRQTYQNLEIIVVNDGSTDQGATEALALSYGDRIRYFYKENGGVSSALNYGIQQMTGDYFAWLSHDDEYAPARIADSVALLARHDLLGKKCVGFTGGYVMDAGGTRIRDLRHCFEPDRIYSGYEVMELMTQHGTLYGCCFLIPRAVFDEVGGFDETLRYSQDSLMWYRIFLSGCELVSDNLPNVMSRMHDAQVSHLRRDLFARDAFVIARLLAEPLAQADRTGVLLLKYLKRLMRYECREAIDYLYTFSDQRGFLDGITRIQLHIFRFLGFFRRWMVRLIKKTLIRFRR